MLTQSIGSPAFQKKKTRASASQSGEFMTPEPPNGLAREFERAGSFDGYAPRGSEPDYRSSFPGLERELVGSVLYRGNRGEAAPSRLWATAA